MKTVYLDHNATTPIASEVRQAMEPFLSAVFGNPSSIHRDGQEARHAIERAREEIAAALGARPQEIVFTGGGSEANNLAVLGAARAAAEKGKRHLVVSAIEHPSVLDAARYLAAAEGFALSLAPSDASGRVDPAAVEKLLRPDTALVSVMHANNETGVVQPVGEIARMLAPRGIPLHVDAAQSFGKIPVSAPGIGAALLSVSAHKVCGPKGAGALVIRERTAVRALFHGGHQEKNIRPGTENVAGLAGLGCAASLVAGLLEGEARRLAALKKILIEALESDPGGVRVNGTAETVPNTANLAFESVEAETLVMNLDLAGVRVSTGAACTAGNTEPSHVLLAMGLGAERAAASVRFSMGRATGRADIEACVAAVREAVPRLRRESARAR